MADGGAAERRGTLWERPDVAETDVTPAYMPVANAVAAARTGGAVAVASASAATSTSTVPEEDEELPPAYAEVAESERR